MTKSGREIAILKTLWSRTEAGRWVPCDLKSLALKPPEDSDSDFFKFESKMELMTQRPPGRSLREIVGAFGSTAFLMKQSIVPVVALVEGEKFIRCIGSAFIISCSGYVMTACHVLRDPEDRDYGKIVRNGNEIQLSGVTIGVLIPLNPAFGLRGFRFFPFEYSWYWGGWKNSPLVHKEDEFDSLTDIAICKIPEMPDGVAHQPLNLSLNSFSPGEVAYAFGYARMDDIPIEFEDGNSIVRDLDYDLYVSVGSVTTVFAKNHLVKEVRTPGPCFDFAAKIPGKMSGGPILGAGGVVVRGVVSSSFSGEKHAYGSMLGPAMHLPLMREDTLYRLMQSGNEGIAKVEGRGL